MGTQPHSAKVTPGAIPAATYLKAPGNLTGKWRISTLDDDEKEAYLHLLSLLSKRTDITGILQSKCPLAEALEHAFRQWFKSIYPEPLLKFYNPVIDIYLHPDDPDMETEGFFKIAIGNQYINWSDFEIADEVEQAEKLWPGTGVAVLNALTKLPFRHYLWTPENIMDFVREMFWFDYPTEQEFMKAEEPDWLEHNDYDSMYPFNDETLETLTRWEKRTPEAEPAPVAQEIIDVCNKIKNNKIDSFAFGTTFPTCIIWCDDNNVISDIASTFEMEQQEMDYFWPQAGGAQWDCRDLKNLNSVLNQIELFVKETDELANAILNFKERMQPWLKKKQ